MSHKIYNLNSTVFAFGNLLDRRYGSIVFREGGYIVTSDRLDEIKWNSSNNGITLITSNQEVVRELKYVGPHGLFISTKKDQPFYIYPVLSHSRNLGSTLPNILINSIPKSGTYFLDRILSELGWSSTKLHLLDWGAVDNYQGMSDAEMHSSPEKVRVQCPSKCIGAILGNGEILAGHLKNRDYIYDLLSEGVREIRIIRNLRNVLISLFRFKLSLNVKSKIDNYLNKPSYDNKEFYEFLVKDATGAVKEIKDVAEYFLNVPSFVTLRFEDIYAGRIDALLQICQISDITAIDVKDAIVRSKNQKTSTWSGKISNWDNFWNDDIEQYFVDSGFHEINRRLGYEIDPFT